MNVKNPIHNHVSLRQIAAGSGSSFAGITFCSQFALKNTRPTRSKSAQIQ